MSNPFISSASWFERTADDFVPYVGHVTAQTALKTDGSVMGMFRLCGPPFALEDHAARNGQIALQASPGAPGPAVYARLAAALAHGEALPACTPALLPTDAA